MLNVMKVKIDPVPQCFCIVNRPPAPIDLGPASNPRLYRMTKSVFRNHLVVSFTGNGHPHCVWTWSYQRHLPTQNIQELRKLIKPRCSQKFSDARHPRVGNTCLLNAMKVGPVLIKSAKLEYFKPA